MSRKKAAPPTAAQPEFPATRMPRADAERNLRAALRIRGKAERHVIGLAGALKEAKGALERANVDVRRWEAELYEEAVFSEGEILPDDEADD